MWHWLIDDSEQGFGMLVIAEQENQSSDSILASMKDPGHITQSPFLPS